MIKLLRKSLLYKDESLLSFIYRLAKDNNCLPKWLLKEYKLDKAYMDNSINFMYNDKRMDLLARACGIDIDIN